MEASSSAEDESQNSSQSGADSPASSSPSRSLTSAAYEDNRETSPAPVSNEPESDVEEPEEVDPDTLAYYDDEEDTEMAAMLDVFEYRCPHGHTAARQITIPDYDGPVTTSKFRCEVCDVVFEPAEVDLAHKSKLPTGGISTPPLTIIIDDSKPEDSASKTSATIDEVRDHLEKSAESSASNALAVTDLNSPNQIIIPIGKHNKLVKTIFGFTVHCKCLINDEVRMTVWIMAIFLSLICLGFFIAYLDMHDFNYSSLQLDERYIAIVIAGAFGLAACVLSYVQIQAHYKHWVHPPSQKCVVRVLLMVPVYSVSAWLSLVFLDWSLYIDFVRVCYEAFVIYAFLILLTKYLGGHAGVTEWMKTKPKQTWPPPWCFFPPVKADSNFLYWLKYGTLQYTIISPIISIIAMMLDFFDLYGDGVTDWSKGYIYIAIIQNVSQLTSLYCLVWLYHCMKNELAPFSPLAKFLVVKSVVFFTWWQGLMLGFLVQWSVITQTGDLDVGQIQVGLQDFLVCFEMFLAAAVHKYTFGYETYANGTMITLMEQRKKYLQEVKEKRALDEIERMEKEEAKRLRLEAGEFAGDYIDENGIVHAFDPNAKRKKRKSKKRKDMDIGGMGSTFIKTQHGPPPLAQPSLLSVLSKQSTNFFATARNAVSSAKTAMAPVTSLLGDEDDDLLFDEDREKEQYAEIISRMKAEREQNLAKRKAEREAMNSENSSAYTTGTNTSGSNTPITIELTRFDEDVPIKKGNYTSISTNEKNDDIV